jgi:hypothetical protein
MRVMVPDAILLSIHQHNHTEHVKLSSEGMAKLEKKHQHCPVDELFDSPFQGTQHSVLSTLLSHVSTYSIPATRKFSIGVSDLIHQRGPPVV